MSSSVLRSRRDLFRPAAHRAPDQALVHIVSLLVQIMPESIDALRAAVAALAGAELEASPHPGKLVVTLEAGDERALADATTRLHEVPGVLTVAIVAHLIESERALAEELADEPTAVSQA